jgi:hypothetical protein
LTPDWSSSTILTAKALGLFSAVNLGLLSRGIDTRGPTTFRRSRIDSTSAMPVNTNLLR